MSKEVTSEFIEEISRVMKKYGFLSETDVRDKQIRNQYKSMRDAGVPGKDAREQLAEKFCTSIKTIEFVLYQRKAKEK